MWREHVDRKHATYLRTYAGLKKKIEKKERKKGGGGGWAERGGGGGGRKEMEIYHPPSLESMRAMIWT